MVKYPKNTSILQMVFLSYLALSVPAILLAYLMTSAVNEELTHHIAFAKTGEIPVSIGESNLLVSFGEYLREHSAPFTNADDQRRYDQATPHDNWINTIHNARAAIIYCWLILLVIGNFIYLALSTNLYNILKRLIAAVDQLRKHKLSNDNRDKEICIDGPVEASNLTASLEKLRLQMNQDEEQQQRFLRHISHEIKTPLTSIIEGAKLLDEQLLGAMNGEQEEVTDILVRSSAELQVAIDNLLNYNVAVAPLHTQTRRNEDLLALVKQALNNNELPIKQKRLVIDSQLMSCRADIDRKQILTVFDNIISNAVKHAPIDSTIKVRLGATTQAEVRLLVKDQGPGVLEKDKAFIFEPFYVGAQANKTTLKGTGLGLSIAKQYVNDHGGNLELRSSRNGAVFQVTLPLN
jgi:two-component system sensor histidine kinase GlrK